MFLAGRTTFDRKRINLTALSEGKGPSKNSLLSGVPFKDSTDPCFGHSVCDCADPSRWVVKGFGKVLQPQILPPSKILRVLNHSTFDTTSKGNARRSYPNPDLKPNRRRKRCPGRAVEWRWKAGCSRRLHVIAEQG